MVLKLSVWTMEYACEFYHTNIQFPHKLVQSCALSRSICPDFQKQVRFWPAEWPFFTLTKTPPYMKEMLYVQVKCATWFPEAPLGFEPRISCLQDRRFNQLSHGAMTTPHWVLEKHNTAYVDIYIYAGQNLMCDAKRPRWDSNPGSPVY